MLTEIKHYCLKLLQLKVSSVRTDVRGLTVYGTTLGNQNNIRQMILDGICIRLNPVDTCSFSNKCHNMKVCRSENSEQIGKVNDKLDTVLL